jgi:hypothetical protein
MQTASDINSGSRNRLDALAEASIYNTMVNAAHKASVHGRMTKTKTKIALFDTELTASQVAQLNQTFKGNK